MTGFNWSGELRDTIRGWMSKKANERAALRRAEKSFLYRQLDLQDYGDCNCFESDAAGIKLKARKA